MGKISPMAESLVAYVEARIISGEYPVGGKLPSVRRLAAKFQLSFGTAYRAIHTLLERGLLEQRGTAGLFVKSHRAIIGGSAGRLAVVMGPMHSLTTGLFHSAYLGVEREAIRFGYQLEVHYIPIEKLTIEKLRRFAADADGILLLSEYDLQLREFPLLPCPVVALQFADSWNGMISTVNVDVADMALIASDYFNKIPKWLRGVEIYTSPKPIFIARALAFESRWRFRGGRCNIHIGYPQDAFVYEADCGYFFTSDHVLQNAALEYQRNHGTRLFDDHAVLGVDGKQFLDPDFFRFPTISVDWTLMGEVMVDEIRRRLAEPMRGTRCIGICGKLCVPPREPVSKDKHS